MKMGWLPFSYLLHDNAVRIKNVGDLEGPTSKFWPGARFGSRRRWLCVQVALGDVPFCALKLFYSEKLSEFLTGIKPVTFWSLVRCSNYWATWTQMVSEGYIYVLIRLMVDICTANLQDSVCHLFILVLINDVKCGSLVVIWCSFLHSHLSFQSRSSFRVWNTDVAKLECENGYFFLF